MKDKYPIGTKLECLHNYMQDSPSSPFIFEQGEKYEIVEYVPLFGMNLPDMCYVAHQGRKVSAWGLKEFELDINFKII